MTKSYIKCAPEATLLLILPNNPKHSLRAKIIFKISYFQRELSKTLQKVDFIFSLEPFPFKREDYENYKESRTSDLHSLYNKFTKFRKIIL